MDTLENIKKYKAFRYQNKNKESTKKILNNMSKAVLVIENGINYLKINDITQLNNENIRKQYTDILKKLENLLYNKN